VFTEVAVSCCVWGASSRFLSIYCLTLPLVLVQQLDVWTAPVVAAVCWGLFSIEEIGTLAE
jgi:ion channel-forming bestrophin family protein